MYRSIRSPNLPPHPQSGDADYFDWANRSGKYAGGPINLKPRCGIYIATWNDAPPVWVPAVWNDAEGWVFMDGNWRKHDEWTLAEEASPLTWIEWRERFPGLPALPEGIGVWK
jgi:hypothetical protein